MKASNSESDFRRLGKQDATLGVKHDLSRLLSTAHEHKKQTFEKYFDGFERLYDQFLKESDTAVEWDKISPPPAEKLKIYDTLPNLPCDDDMKKFVDKLVVLKLNGGLGTSMGCTGPKSLISVRSDFTFLDLNVQQIEFLNKRYGCSVPLVLMNSFNTHEDTERMLQKYVSRNITIHCFLQSQYPRIGKESLRPIAVTLQDGSIESWYPPGHGDTYESLYNSGLLAQFIREGKEFVFISNIDNLGATVDEKILNFLVNPAIDAKCDFVMEVTDKTRADVKGGTLIEYDNKIRLLEIAQVPKEHVDDFKAVNKFRIFNTNNLWIRLGSIYQLVKSNTLHREVIVNNKTLDNGLNIIQLETAVGAAIKNFNGALGINVPRRRFLPVKKSSDLLLVMSNLYSMKHGSLSMSPLRQFPSTPLVQLSGQYFVKVKDFLSRFASIPDVLELDHLTVSGDVTFGRHVTLKGTVIIIANHGDRIDIPSGAVLENKIVSGNLRILDH